MTQLITYNVKFNATTSIRSENNGLGFTNGKQLTIAARCRFDEDGLQQFVVADGALRLWFRKNADNTLHAYCYNAAVERIASRTWTSTAATDGDYHDFLLSFDTSEATEKIKAYVDGVKVTSFDAQDNDTTDDMDMDGVQWVIAGKNTLNLLNGGVGFVAAHNMLIGGNVDSAILGTCFDSNGNFTDPGLDCSNWFGVPAGFIYRPTVGNVKRNLGNQGGDFTDRVAGSEYPVIDSPVTEARMPTDQTDNWMYTAINDIDVTDGGAGSSSIVSTASGFSVYDAVTNPQGLKVGDYVTATGSMKNEYQVTSVTTSTIIVSGSMTDYTKTTAEYASVYQIGRRPTA